MKKDIPLKDVCDPCVFERDSQRVLNQIVSWANQIGESKAKVDETTILVIIESVLEIWRTVEDPVEDTEEDVDGCV